MSRPGARRSLKAEVPAAEPEAGRDNVAGSHAADSETDTEEVSPDIATAQKP
jgi:hypothetical protein